jgi:hypothetical protein
MVIPATAHAPETPVPPATPYSPISWDMDLDLTDDEKNARIKELDGIIREDRYPLSPRIQS